MIVTMLISTNVIVCCTGSSVICSFFFFTNFTAVSIETPKPCKLSVSVHCQLKDCNTV